MTACINKDAPRRPDLSDGANCRAAQRRPLYEWESLPPRPSYKAGGRIDGPGSRRLWL